MIDHARAINQASPTARVLVVISPCNTNCLIAMSHAQDVPREHWFALNQVLRSRAIAMVAEKVRVPVTQVTRLTVWGNNSETAFVDLHNARIGECPAVQVIGDPNWSHEVFDPAIAASSARSSDGLARHPPARPPRRFLPRSGPSPRRPHSNTGSAPVSSPTAALRVPRGLVFGFPLVTTDGKSWSIPRDTISMPSPGTDCPERRRARTRGLGSLTPAGEGVRRSGSGLTSRRAGWSAQGPDRSHALLARSCRDRTPRWFRLGPLWSRRRHRDRSGASSTGPALPSIKRRGQAWRFCYRLSVWQPPSSITGTATSMSAPPSSSRP